MAVSLVTTIDNDKWYSYNDKFCLCFADPDYFTDPVAGITTLEIGAVAYNNGETFIWFGDTYTFFNAVPANPFQIQIDANLEIFTERIKEALEIHPNSTSLDYVITYSEDSITFTERCPGSVGNVDFTAGSSPLSETVVTASSAGTINITDYSVQLWLSLLINTDNNFEVQENNKIRDLFITPSVVRNQDCSYTVDLCSDIAAFIRWSVRNDFVDFVTSLETSTSQMRSEWVVGLDLKYWAYVAGLRSGYPLNYPEWVYFLNARESDIIPDWQQYHPDPLAVYQHKWLVNNPDNLQVCSVVNASVSYFVYVDHEPSYGASTTWILDHTITPDVGMVIAFSENIIIERDTILQWTGSVSSRILRPGRIPLDFVGVVTLQARESGDQNGRESEVLSIRFDGSTDGGCNNPNTLCGPCTTTFRYLNKFGVWDMLQAGCEKIFGLTVQTKDYIPCNTCDIPNLGAKAYYKTYTETYQVLTRRIDLGEDQERAAIIDFLTSPEIYVLTDREYSPLPKYQRVVVDAGETLKESPTKENIQLTINYKLVKDQFVNVNP